MTATSPIYGIKLVTPDHFKYKCFEADYHEHDTLSTLMNFKDNSQGRSAANKLVPGSRAILYVSRQKWFARAFEVTGTIEEGNRVACCFDEAGWDMFAATNPYRIYLPIHWLASVDPAVREDPQIVSERAGVDFKPNSYTFKQLTGPEYQRLYDSIQWSWTRGSGPMPSLSTPTPEIKSESRVAPRSLTTEPWLPTIIERIRHVAPLPERNHEAVVSEFLTRLGVKPNQIVYQQGRIDISVNDSSGRIMLVVEVKQNLNVTAQAARARAQAQQYGEQVGCNRCAVTDGDLWELHDLSRGERYDQRYLGAFRLTELTDHDSMLVGRLCDWLGV